MQGEENDIACYLLRSLIAGEIVQHGLFDGRHSCKPENPGLAVESARAVQFCALNHSESRVSHREYRGEAGS
jgi:hypothetical protein